MDSYSIKDIIQYRELNWPYSEDFLYMTKIPDQFESFTLKPDYFCCGIITKGSLTIQVDTEINTVEQHSFLIYRPEQIVKILAITPDSKGAFILFSKKFISYLNADSLQAPFSFLNRQFGSNTNLSPVAHHRLASFFEKLFDLLGNIYEEHWEHSAKNLISVLLTEIDAILRKRYLETTDNTGNIREITLMKDFKHLAQEYFFSNRTVPFYASKLCVSPSYLHKVVKRQLQTTPSAYIHSFVFNEAKTLLSQSANNIGEVAGKLSFSDIHSFSKYFKKHAGISPRQFRIEISLE